MSPLQLVNLHRNRRYFVIKLHTWFCLSYCLKTNIKFYCIYQYYFSINSFFNTVSVSRYSRPIANETSHVTTHATHSDPWPTLARSTRLFLICCLNIMQGCLCIVQLLNHDWVVYWVPNNCGYLSLKKNMINALLRFFSKMLVEPLHILSQKCNNRKVSIYLWNVWVILTF